MADDQKLDEQPRGLSNPAKLIIGGLLGIIVGLAAAIALFQICTGFIEWIIPKPSKLP